MHMYITIHLYYQTHTITHIIMYMYRNTTPFIPPTCTIVHVYHICTCKNTHLHTYITIHICCIILHTHTCVLTYNYMYPKLSINTYQD